MSLRNADSVMGLHACMRTLIATAHQVLNLVSKAAVHGLQTCMQIYLHHCIPHGSLRLSTCW